MFTEGRGAAFSSLGGVAFSDFSDLSDFSVFSFEVSEPFSDLSALVSCFSEEASVVPLVVLEASPSFDCVAFDRTLGDEVRELLALDR
jgi:hypothetical protein